MKTVFVAAIAAVSLSTSFADIQDPPSNDYGPTRKLGRGLSNLIFAPAEVFVTIGRINTTEGNSAAYGYGVVRGLGRSASRHFAGLVETLLAPFPTWRNGYYPMLPSETRYIHAGYAEFPPELGFETRYEYVRDYAY
jgi:putative exosortase-associated protein (TIGR04073 family)